MNISLQLPLRNISVNQPFGVNYFDFYKKMGLPYHTGVDFRALDGFKCYAAHKGTIIGARTYSDGGLGVEIDCGDFTTFYYHLKDIAVKVGDIVVGGQLIGTCDNTGLMTTGSHLHFELRIKNQDGFITKVDPTPYWTMAHDGTPIKNKDCYESNAYHRYFRKDGRNYKNEVRVLGELVKYFKRLPKVWQINAAVYGAWDRENLANPSMADLCAFLTKGEYLNGKKQFQN